jgi:hypothetical protein
MTTDNFCIYLQNRLIQTSQTGGQQYSDTSPFSVPFFGLNELVVYKLRRIQPTVKFMTDATTLSQPHTVSPSLFSISISISPSLFLFLSFPLAPRCIFYL